MPFDGWIRRPYKIARQQHLGEFLDYLESAGYLRWSLRHDGSTAVWIVSEGGRSPREYQTRQAEKLAERIAEWVPIYWRPVPSPGGKELYLQYRQHIAAKRRKLGQEPLYHGPGQPDELPI
ncbi:hypothetical protein [Cellulosimicrobium sp. JZ28]|uniref:hypothetical protein n=1 Tax=Cellulosimicrobium sp. JZ28 TaxID=1906273 RepID=UPI00188B92C4|nr:hypothetical protein [Cellulosimicrobium sp. JZ28]